MLFSGLKYKGPFSIDYRERGSHARGVYPTPYTSRMGTAKMKQEEGTRVPQPKIRLAKLT